MGKKSKDDRKKALKIVVIVLLSIMLSVLLFSLATNLAARKAQVDSLNSVSDDLKNLYTKLATKPTVNKKTSDFQKVCYQSSAKLSQGSIRCGSEGIIVFSEPLSYESQKKDSIDLINQSTSFGYKMTEDTHDDKTGAVNGFAIHFVHSSTGTLCDLILGPQQYVMICLQTVPDFLPGYTVEK